MAGCSSLRSVVTGDLDGDGKLGLAAVSLGADQGADVEVNSVNDSLRIGGVGEISIPIGKR